MKIITICSNLQLSIQITINTNQFAIIINSKKSFTNRIRQAFHIYYIIFITKYI